MDKDEIEINLNGYCGDIKKFVEIGDYSSAQRLVSGLRKFIVDLKKGKDMFVSDQYRERK